MKITKSHLQGMFNRLLSAAGKRESPCYLSNGKSIVREYGAWSLVHDSVYGWTIEGDCEGGGIYHPFGSLSLTAREIYQGMYMAAQALEQRRKEEYENK